MANAQSNVRSIWD